MPGPDDVLERATELLREVADTQAVAIDQAARVIAQSYQDDGVLQAFGTGHSRIVAHELAGRANGLIRVNLLAVKDLALYGGEPARPLMDPTVERDPSLAARILALADIRPTDCFLIVSSSGTNGAVVEMAQQVTKAGHPLIAITSPEHSLAAPSRHPSGRRLMDLADVVIDNRSGIGDGLLQLPDGKVVGAASSIAGVGIAQMLQASVVRELLAAGRPVELYTSQNLTGGDEANALLLRKLGQRVRLIEP